MFLMSCTHTLESAQACVLCLGRVDDFTCPECNSDDNTVLQDDYGPNRVILCQSCRYLYGRPKAS